MAGGPPPEPAGVGADSTYYAAHPLDLLRATATQSETGPVAQAARPYDPDAELAAVRGTSSEPYDPDAELAAIQGQPSAAQSLFDHFTNGLAQNFGPKIQAAGEALGNAFQRQIGRQPEGSGTIPGDYQRIRDYWMNQLAAETKAHKYISGAGGLAGEVLSPVNAALPFAGEGATTASVIGHGAMAGATAAGLNAAGDATGDASDYAQHVIPAMATGFVAGGLLPAVGQKLGRLGAPSQEAVNAKYAALKANAPVVTGQPVKDLVQMVRNYPSMSDLYERVRANHATDKVAPVQLPAITPEAPMIDMGAFRNFPAQSFRDPTAPHGTAPTSLPITAFDQMKKGVDAMVGQGDMPIWARKGVAPADKQEGLNLAGAMDKIITGADDKNYPSVDKQVPAYPKARAMAGRQIQARDGSGLNPVKLAASMVLPHSHGAGALFSLLSPGKGETANLGARLLTHQYPNVAAGAGPAAASLLFPPSQPDSTQ